MLRLVITSTIGPMMTLRPSHRTTAGSCGRTLHVVRVTPRKHEAGAIPPQKPAGYQSMRSLGGHSPMACRAIGASGEEPRAHSSFTRMASSICAASLLVLSAFMTPAAAQADLPSWVPFSGSAQQYQKTPVDKMPEPNLAELTPEEAATVRVFIDNTPSVVNISNNVLARNVYSMDVMTIPQGMGSGFVWDDKGHVVTNYHVIRGATSVKVTLIDQSSYDAEVIGADANRDVAVLKLDIPEDKAKALKKVQLGLSSSLQVGQKVYAIGNPFGLDHAMTSGIISGLGRELPNSVSGYKVRNVIQTDAAINPGNSGGVLLNSRGQLIGVNTAIVGTSGGFSGVGFAIPIDMVKGLVEQILQYGKIVRPVLGITLAPPQILDRLKLSGVLVLEVNDGSPAAQAGVQSSYRSRGGDLVLGDIIVGIDGTPVTNYSDLFDSLDSKKPQDKVSIDLLRATADGKFKKVTLRVTLGERSLKTADS